MAPACDDGSAVDDDGADTNGSSSDDGGLDSELLANPGEDAGGDEMAAPLTGSRAELDALADKGVILRTTPGSIEMADRRHAERLHAAELRVRSAASEGNGERLAAIIAPARNAQLTKEGNYRVTIADAEVGAREVITMGPATTTLDLAAALDGLGDPKNQLAAYRALHENITPAARERLRAVAPDSLASARAGVIRAELERLVAHPDLLGLLAVPPAHGAQPVPTADNSEPACTPSAASGVVANFAFPLKSKLSLVKNQGNRGSCTAFAVTSAVETARSVGGGGLPNYSEQDLYYRAKAEWSGLTNYGDGLDVSSTLNLAASKGYHFASESSWPYNPAYSRIDIVGYYLNSCTGYTFNIGTIYGNYCSDTAHQGGRYCIGQTCFYSSPVSAGTGSRVSSAFDILVSVPMIKVYLSLNKSLVMSFKVMNSFQKPAAGGYVNAFPFEPTIGSHAIHLVGTIDNAQLAIAKPGAPAGGGGGYVILKNSWGSYYGDGGFVYMSYDTFVSYAYAVRVADVVN